MKPSFVRVHQWALCEGRPESGDREQELFNRNRTLLDGTDVYRMPIQVTGSDFDEADTNILLANVPYRIVFERFFAHPGANKILFTFLLHQNQGDSEAPAITTLPARS